MSTRGTHFTSYKPHVSVLLSPVCLMSEVRETKEENGFSVLMVCESECVNLHQLHMHVKQVPILSLLQQVYTHPRSTRFRQFRMRFISFERLYLHLTFAKSHITHYMKDNIPKSIIEALLCDL